jgi:hypothetical protein
MVAASSLITACSTGSSPAGAESSRAAVPSPPIAPSAADSCVAAAAQSAVGQRANEALLESARVAARARVARFLRPNQPVTMEFNGSRLNLDLDEREVVRGVSCG